jgi:hypothetical protein
MHRRHLPARDLPLRYFAWSGLLAFAVACGSSSNASPSTPQKLPDGGSITTPAVDGGGAPAVDGGSGGSSSCALPNYPDATCTGVPAGTALTKVSGDLQVKDDNAVVDGKDVAGCIVVIGTGVTISNSKAQCITVGQSDRARDPANPPLIVKDTEVACPDKDGTTAMGDRNFKAQRVNIHGCENGFDVDSDATIEDSFIHDLHQSQIAHTDGLQSAVGSNLVIRHNRFDAETPGACGTPSGHTTDCGGTSAININNDPSGPVSTHTIVADNILAGGAYTMYCPYLTPQDFHVTGNHWSRRFYPNGGAFGPSADCLENDGKPRTTEWTGNIWDDTKTPIAP